MKKKIRRRRCKHCDDLFKPDSRNLKRQKFCRKSECKETGKQYSQQKWLMKPKNKGYFSGSANVIRVQQWRQGKPGYWKRGKSKKTTSLSKYPGPQDQVRVQRLCPLYDSMLLNDRVVPTTKDQGATNESISKVITNDMALPISYCLGSKV